MLKYLLSMCLLILASPAFAEIKSGDVAPNIVMKDTGSQDFSLSALKGSTVVLEWTNHLCPFVRKHYESGNMQKAQKFAAEHDVKWVRIISSAPGMQGHVSPAEANQIAKDAGVVATATLIDEGGEIGNLYGAKTTPHMFVIDKEGKVAYAGAIDSIASVDKADIAKADNYVIDAITALSEGKPLKVASSQPYGCSVKYAH